METTLETIRAAVAADASDEAKAAGVARMPCDPHGARSDAGRASAGRRSAGDVRTRYFRGRVDASGHAARAAARPRDRSPPDGATGRGPGAGGALLMSYRVRNDGKLKRLVRIPHELKDEET